MVTTLSILDILYLTLAVGFGLISIFLCVLLFRLSKTVGLVNKIAEKVQSITEAVDHCVWQPIHFVQKILEKIKDKTD